MAASQFGATMRQYIWKDQHHDKGAASLEVSSSNLGRFLKGAASAPPESAAMKPIEIL
jgi:hypothetical protein